LLVEILFSQSVAHAVLWKRIAHKNISHCPEIVEDKSPAQPNLRPVV
jgi:hypothetical protein